MFKRDMFRHEMFRREGRPELLVADDECGHAAGMSCKHSVSSDAASILNSNAVHEQLCTARIHLVPRLDATAQLPESHETDQKHITMQQCIEKQHIMNRIRAHKLQPMSFTHAMLYKHTAKSAHLAAQRSF